MCVLIYSGTNAVGLRQEYVIILPNNNIELAFEHVSNQITNGFCLLSVKLINEDSSPTVLPTEAFDGQRMVVPLQQLKAQWKSVLNLPW